MSDRWPKRPAPLPADPAVFREELLRCLADPDAVLVLNGDGSVHGVREMTLGEWFATVEEGS
jgi:hypothetical protein